MLSCRVGFPAPVRVSTPAEPQAPQPSSLLSVQVRLRGAGLLQVSGPWDEGMNSNDECDSHAALPNTQLTVAQLCTT